MPEPGTTGTSWQRAFPAAPIQAHAARAWAAMYAVHPDARIVAGELFVAVLGAHPSLVQMTVSTAGPRRRIAATGSWPLATHRLHGPGRVIISALCTAHGVTVDDCGLWAELTWDES